MDKKTKYIGNFMGFGASYDGAVWDKEYCSPTIRAAASHGSAPYTICKLESRTKKKITREGVGGIYINVSENFQRGVLEGVSRTIKAGTHDCCAVCRVRYEKKIKNSDSNEGEGIDSQKNGIRQRDQKSV